MFVNKPWAAELVQCSAMLDGLYVAYCTGWTEFKSPGSSSQPDEHEQVKKPILVCTQSIQSWIWRLVQSWLSTNGIKMCTRVITAEIRRRSSQFLPTAYIWIPPNSPLIKSDVVNGSVARQKPVDSGDREQNQGGVVSDGEEPVTVRISKKRRRWRRKPQTAKQ